MHLARSHVAVARDADEEGLGEADALAAGAARTDLAVEQPVDAVDAGVAQEGVARAAETQPGVRIRAGRAVAPRDRGLVVVRPQVALEEIAAREHRVGIRADVRCRRVEGDTRVEAGLGGRAERIGIRHAHLQIEVARDLLIHKTEAVEGAEDVMAAGGQFERIGGEAVSRAGQRGELRAVNFRTAETDAMRINVEAGQTDHGTDHRVVCADGGAGERSDAGDHHGVAARHRRGGREQHFRLVRAQLLHRVQRVEDAQAGSPGRHAVDQVVAGNFRRGHVHRLVKAHTNGAAVHAARREHVERVRRDSERDGGAGDCAGGVANYDHVLIAVAGEGLLRGGVFPVARAGNRAAVAIPLEAERTVTRHTRRKGREAALRHALRHGLLDEAHRPAHAVVDHKVVNEVDATVFKVADAEINRGGIHQLGIGVQGRNQRLHDWPGRLTVRAHFLHADGRGVIAGGETAGQALGVHELHGQAVPDVRREARRVCRRV